MSDNSSTTNDTNYHVCRICSDRAIGYNFSVLTCEPCKAFFRRTADKLDELQCPFNNDCDIDRVTRKICRKCRLVKCLKVGMRKDWVQNEDDKKSRSSDSNRSQPLHSPMKDVSFLGRRHPIGINRRGYINNDQLRNINPFNSPRAAQDFESHSSSGLSSIPTCSPHSRISPMNQFPMSSLSSLLTPSSSSSSFADLRKPSYLMSPSSNLLSNSSTDLTNRLPCSRQPGETVQNTSRSFNDSDWVIKFLVENHALNSRLTSPDATINRAQLDATMSNQNCNQSLQSDTNPCARVGVIVDGRKLVTSPSVLNHENNVPPVMTRDTLSFNQQDSNLKTRVIRKILDANFAPSYLKQGSREGVGLNQLEMNAIDCVLNAFNFFNQPSSSTRNELASVEGVTRFTDLYVEKLISGCRSLPSYSELCLEDQITLVKAGFSNILAVKSHLSSDLSANSWQANNQRQMRLETSSFQNDVDQSLVAHLTNDPKVVCILITIVLYNPDLPNLQAVDTIKLEQYTYIYLLRRYLESRCGSSCRARTEHFNLIHTVEKVMTIRQQRIAASVQMNSHK